MKPGEPLACRFNALSKVLTTCPWHFRCNPSFPWSLSPSCLSPSFPSFIKHSGESWRMMVSHILWQTRELIHSSLCAKKALNDHLFPPCMCKQSFSQSDGFTGDRISAEGSYQPQTSVPWLYRFEMNKLLYKTNDAQFWVASEYFFCINTFRLCKPLFSKSSLSHLP